MDAIERPPSAATRVGGRVFEHIEHVFYLAAGVMVCAAAAFACIQAALVLVGVAGDMSNETGVVEVIDRLLFVLMLVEILHTIHVSLRTGSLRPEPFLTVGLIASIRRLLVITLESSTQMQLKNWTEESMSFFRATMIELSVLTVLILVLVIALHLVRRTRGA